jgi:serine/threonine protein kinase
VVLFEMVCGTLPFVRAEMMEVVRDHLVTPAPPPTKFTPSLSVELEAAILKALEKDPQKRFQTAEEFQSALMACLQSSTAVGAPPPASLAQATTPSKVSPPSLRDRAVLYYRRHTKRVLTAAGALTLIVVAGLIVALLHSSAPAPTTEPQSSAAVFAPPVPISSAARRHLSLAEDYQRKLWCSDAIDELERTLREEPQLRSNPDLTRTAIPCLRARTQSKTVRFLVEDVGDDARPELEAALAMESKPDVREGIERALARLANPRQ